MLGTTIILKAKGQDEDKSDFDKEPDYVFVVKNYGAPFLTRVLMDLKLIVKEFKS